MADQVKTKSTSTPNQKAPEKKKKYEISEQDVSWFWDHYELLLMQSPISSSSLDPQEPFTKLVNSLSEELLTETTPAIKGFETSIISEQIDDESSQWSALFQDVFLKQSPSFIFANANVDKSYLSMKTKEFLDWLYSPLLRQYTALLNDIITYNYSTYSIPLEIFKNKTK